MPGSGNVFYGIAPADCGFCAQPVHFDTGIDTYGFLDPEEILSAAKHTGRDGAQRFGIVGSIVNSPPVQCIRP